MDRTSLLPAKDLMGRLWRLDIPRTSSYPILEKYEIALELNGKPPPCKGRWPYQDAKCLVELRNALIHFEPETIVSRATGEEAEIHKFEKRLRGKFTENPLTGAGNPFYPDKLLGAGCANWAVQSAVAYTDHFFGLLGVTPTYEHVRNEYL